MRSSPKSLTAALKLPSAGTTRILQGLRLAAFALAVCTVPMAHADATLTYELSDAETGKSLKKFSTARFFVRIEDPAQPDRFLLFQAGKFFPLFEVDQAKGTYTRLTEKVIPYMSPHSRKNHGADKAAEQDQEQKTTEDTEKPASRLKATRKKQTVAGIQCRVVQELQDGKPAIEHCMANSARLGITDREVITMARTFEMARKRELGWVGIGSQDEEFISVHSKDLRTGKAMTLTAVSAEPLTQGYLKIPREYKEVERGKQAAVKK